MTGIMQVMLGGSFGPAAPASFIGLAYSADTDVGTSVAADSLGNIYFVGYNATTVTGMSILKYSAGGTLLWQRKISLAPGYFATSVQTDASDNVIVVGHYASAEMELVKYNSSGTLQWQVNLSGGTSQAKGVTLDSSSNIYLSGYSSNGGSNDIITAKFNSSGALQWQRYLDNAGNQDQGNAITIDSSSNVYVCGTINTTGLAGLQLAKYNSSGTIQWQVSLGDSSRTKGWGVSVDSSNNIYVVGSSAYPNGGASEDAIIAKYNSSGTLQWQRTLHPASGNAVFYGVSTDSTGNSYAVGQIVGSTDILLAKYDNAGSIQWQRSLSSSGSDYGASVKMTATNTIYICGYSTVSGTLDILFASLPTNGSLSGTYSVNGYSFTYGASSLTDSALTLTSATSSLTAGTSTLTSATTSGVDAAGALTSSVTTL